MQPRQRRLRGAPLGKLALFLLCLVSPTAGCGRETPSADGQVEAERDAAVAATDSAIAGSSASRATPPPSTGCVGRLAEYCARFEGECPTYAESVERRKSMCGRWVVSTSACGHRFRSVGWREPLLGGGEEYFDPGGRLIAAHVFTDHGTYCGGRSFTRTFGTVPTCPTRPLAKTLCQRPGP
jgi:hypothetical protein